MSNILYSRVSSKDQGQDSLNTQTQLCLAFLSSKGIKLDSFYSEIGSAYNGDQPVLNSILDKYTNCNLYILNASRFSRNIVNGVTMLKKSYQANINIVFIEDNLESSNVSHRHMIRTKILEAQQESEILSNRITSRNNLKRSRGWKFGNPIFGKKAKLNDKKVRKFVESKEETNIINFITQAREGCSCRELNKKLKKIKKNADEIKFFDKDGETEINYFDRPNTLTYQEIADLLNDYEISKRGKEWTSSSVSGIYNTFNVDGLSKKIKNINV